MKRLRRLVSLPAFAIVVAVLMTAGSASATSPGRNGRVLWAMSRSTAESGDIFTIAASGGVSRNLTQSPALEDRVAVAPNGLWIAFERCEIQFNCLQEIFAMRPDGSDVHRVAASGYRPVWSPDGREIAYAGPLNQLRVVTVDGSGDRELSPEQSQRPDPAWSPDGTRIAYFTGSSLAVVPAGGGAGVEIARGQAGYGFAFDWQPEDSRLVFANTEEVFSVAPDGSDRRPVLRLPRSPTTLAAGPEGRLAFTLDEAGAPGYSIHVYDGKDLRQVGEVPRTGFPPRLAWSPGGRLAFAQFLGPQIFLLDRDFTMRTLRPEPAPVSASVDGLGWLGVETLVYAAHVHSGSDLYTKETDGSDLRRLTQTYREELLPKWSPDGRRIAFGAAGDVHIMAGTGGRARRVTRNPLDEGHPSWSPDGTQIAFTRRTGASSRIVVRDLLAGRERVIRRGAGSPAWSPDGTLIAGVTVLPRTFWRVFVMRPDGSGFRLIDRASDAFGSPSWSPDGRRVVFLDELDGGCDSHQPGPSLQSRTTPPPCVGVVIVTRAGKKVAAYYDRDYDYGPAVEWSPDGRKLVIGDGLVLRNGARRKDPGAAFNLQPRCTLEGTSRRDRLRGTPGNDVICGFGGDDRIDGRGGHDVIYGGDGADVLVGGTGPDWLFGGPGADRIVGRDRTRDVVDGGHGRDRLSVDRRDVAPRPWTARLVARDR